MSKRAESKTHLEGNLSDRLNLAAKQIKLMNQLPDQELVNAIGDSVCLQDYLKLCLNHPIANAILGAIIFGWQLNDESRKLIEATGVVHLA